jgi:EAL domain-containing protein (putative c-di-GMP-specific phosphodiesterase class I)
MNKPLAHGQSKSASDGRQVLCFVVDTDFVYLREFAKSLRSLGVDTAEFINSGRLGENVENLNPAVVFLNLNAADPCDCVRAIMALKECKFPGLVQLMGRCEPGLLESFRKIGGEAALKMLPPLAKPIDFSIIRKILNEQKLNRQPAAPPDLSLKTALTRNWIQFWYQPQMELASKVMVGAETLVRVAHPQHGILSPARFMVGASDEDLTELAVLALVSALATSAKLFQARTLVKLAINVSAEILIKLPVADLIQAHRPRDDRWPGLTFDVAETQVLNKMAILKSKFPELKRCGISLAIDNFGRGNSSFEVFRHLPFSEIKIDGSMVQGCAGDKVQANICKSMVQFAHNFGSKAVAAGIETNADALELKELGCDLGQGYALGKPMSESDLLTMVAAACSQPAGNTQPLRQAG